MNPAQQFYFSKTLDLPARHTLSDKDWQGTAGLPFPGNDGIFVR